MPWTNQRFGFPRGIEMTSPSQIERTAVPNYLYLTPDVPEMRALGIQSQIIIAEQLTINDRLHPDRYIISQITGLRGSDIRDTRIPHPSAHGEIPYNAFFSGKTLSFEGTIEAGNIDSLGRLERDLMAALGPLPSAALGNYYSQSIAVEYLTALQALPEFPVRFNWWDQNDAFYDPLSIAFWSQLSGDALLIPGTGRCTTSGAGATLSYHNLRGGFIDEVVTAQVSVIALGGANQIGVVSCCNSITSYLQAVVTWDGASAWTLVLQAVQGSGTTTLASAAIYPPLGQATWWIQMQTIADEITASVYDVDPRANPATILNSNSPIPPSTPLATVSTQLLGTLAEQFGYKISGFCGLTATSTANWAFLDWRVDSLWPCDFVIGARLIQSPAMSHQVMKQVDRFKRDFQFSIRASDPRILCPTPISTTVELATAPDVELGRVYPRIYTLVYLTPLSEPSGVPVAQIEAPGLEVTIVNKGTWIAKPVVTFFGGIENPVLTNFTTGVSLALDGIIADGDYAAVDCNRFTVTNKAGNNVFGLFDPTSAWLTLAPGPNLLQFTGSNAVGSPLCTVAAAHSWI